MKTTKLQQTAAKRLLRGPRDLLKKTYILADGRQVLSDGYKAIIYNSPVDSLPVGDPTDCPAIIQKVIEQARNYDSEAIALPTLEQLKAAKAEGKTDTGNRNKIFALKGERLSSMFNVDYLITMIQALRPTRAELCKEYPKQYPALYLESAYGNGIVLPLRVIA